MSWHFGKVTSESNPTNGDRFKFTARTSTVKTLRTITARGTDPRQGIQGIVRSASLPVTSISIGMSKTRQTTLILQGKALRRNKARWSKPGWKIGQTNDQKPLQTGVSPSLSLQKRNCKGDVSHCRTLWTAVS
jgi:hypothetical protein